MLLSTIWGLLVKVVCLLFIMWPVNTEIADSSLTAFRVHSTQILIDNKGLQFSYQRLGLSPGTLPPPVGCHDIAEKLLKLAFPSNKQKHTVISNVIWKQSNCWPAVEGIVF